MLHQSTVFVDFPIYCMCESSRVAMIRTAHEYTFTLRVTDPSVPHMRIMFGSQADVVRQGV